MKRIHTIYALILLLTSPLVGRAQEVMSLADCVTYAQQHSPLLTSPQLRATLAKRSLLEAKLAFLPSLNAGVGESFSFGRSQDKTGVYKDVSSASTSFSLGGSMTLFDGGATWYAYKKSDLADRLSHYEIEQAEDQIALRVVDAYISLLLNQEIASIARERLALTQRSLADVEAQVRVGRLSDMQLMEMRTQVAGDRIAVADTEADVRRAKKLLLLEMGITDRDEITIASQSSEQLLRTLEQADAHTRNAAWVAPAIAIAEGGLAQAEYDIKQARAALLPSLSLSAGYNNSYYYNLDKALKPFNVPFGDQIEANGRSYIGLSLNIPLFTRGQLSGAVARAQLQKTQLTAELIQRRSDEERNVALARIDLDKAVRQQKLATEQVDVAAQAFKYADLQFANGRLSTYEWEQAKNKESEARANYSRSLYSRLQHTLHLKYFNTGVIDLTLAQ